MPEYKNYINLSALASNIVRRIRKDAPELNYNQSKDLFKEIRQQLGIKPIKRRKGTVKRLTPSQLERLLNAAYNHSPKRGLIVQTLYETGTRVAEFCDLEITDLKVPEQILIIRKGKGDKRREIPLSQHLVRQLQNHIGKRQTGAIFRSDRRPKYSERAIQLIVKNTATTAQIIEPSVSPHTLRHTRATLLAEGSMSKDQLQVFLGHENPNTTQIYTLTAAVEMRNAFETATKSIKI